MTEPEMAVQCSICGGSIAPTGDDPGSMTLTIRSDPEAVQTLWAHAHCLHRLLRRVALLPALPGALELLPLDLALQSASPNEIVLPSAQAVHAVHTLSAAGHRLLGWEGWVRDEAGRVGHESVNGTVDLASCTVQDAARICCESIQTATEEWNGRADRGGRELLFCLTVAAA